MKQITANRTARILFLALALLLLLSGCGTPSVFEGSMVTDETGFHLEYSILNKELTADLMLNEGEQLRVVFTHESGDVDIKAGQSGKEPIYTGTSQANGDFTLVIPENGTYHISVTGHKAKGRVDFYRAP